MCACVHVVWRLPRGHGWPDQRGHTGVMKSLAPWVLWSRAKHERRQCCSPAGAAACWMCVTGAHEAVGSPPPRTLMRDPSDAPPHRSRSMAPSNWCYVVWMTIDVAQWTRPITRWPKNQVTFNLQGSQICTHSNCLLPKLKKSLSSINPTSLFSLVSDLNSQSFLACTLLYLLPAVFSCSACCWCAAAGQWFFRHWWVSAALSAQWLWPAQQHMQHYILSLFHFSLTDSEI